jgi:hypothetical protein
MPTILIHISNEDPILGEVENLPGLNDQSVKVKNPRRRDGKDLHYLQASVTEVIWPMLRISFIEIIPGDQEDQIIGFVREP